jgi:hypothetical protein
MFMTNQRTEENRSDFELEAGVPRETSRLLGRLEHLTLQMRVIGQVAFFSCVAAIVSTFVELSVRFGRRNVSFEDFELQMPKLLTVTLCLGGFLLIAFFETRRRRGDVFFDELSNELQWSGPTRPAKTVAQEKPPIRVRIILREFVQASDLPLLPGRYGPAAYAFIFIIVAIAAYLVGTPLAKTSY